jgi:hypothetical protein
MPNLTQEDWLLILEGLVQLAGPGIETSRKRRAWELFDIISNELDHHDTPPSLAARNQYDIISFYKNVQSENGEG